MIDHGIVYQIFPDRFAIGTETPLIESGQWAWRGTPIVVSDDPIELTELKSHQYTFFGGNLAGVTQRLPHLRELGISTVYLNPIFAARSSHRYDAIDYTAIDAALGTRADFEKLADTLHESGMRLVLDGVFNHTSVDHPWHVDTGERVKRYVMQTDTDAMTWMGSGGLPKLDTQRQLVVDSLMDVLRAWPEVDGWRLDAGHLLPQALLRQIKAEVQPRTIHVEDWNNGRHYFINGLADGTTHFPFREALKTFFDEDSSPETLFERISVYFDVYPTDAAAASWTYLDNHDLPRFQTEVGRSRYFRALVLLLTMPGTPLLFQGMEMGMTGDSAEASRKPLVWDESTWDRELFAHVQRLTGLRRRFPAALGSDPRTFIPRVTDNRTRTLMFERRALDSSVRAIVAINDGYEACEIDDAAGGFRIAPGEWLIRVESPDGSVHDQYMGVM